MAVVGIDVECKCGLVDRRSSDSRCRSVADRFVPRLPVDMIDEYMEDQEGLC